MGLENLFQFPAISFFSVSTLIISTLLFLNCWHFKAASWVKRSEAAIVHRRHLSASHHLRTRELNISDSCILLQPSKSYSNCPQRLKNPRKLVFKTWYFFKDSITIKSQYSGMGPTMDHFLHVLLGELTMKSTQIVICTTLVYSLRRSELMKQFIAGWSSLQLTIINQILTERPCSGILQ